MMTTKTIRNLEKCIDKMLKTGPVHKDKAIEIMADVIGCSVSNASKYFKYLEQEGLIEPGGVFKKYKVNQNA
jgi:hypothetical protein